jgi:hypothetical protein
MRTLFFSNRYLKSLAKAGLGIRTVRRSNRILTRGVHFVSLTLKVVNIHLVRSVVWQREKWVASDTRKDAAKGDQI